jgi:hypothetical protein
MKLFCTHRSPFFCLGFYSHRSTKNKNKMKRALVSLVRQRALATGAESAKVKCSIQ